MNLAGFKKCPGRFGIPSENLSFAHFNGHTLAQDETGQMWSKQGYVDPGDYFAQTQVEVAERDDVIDASRQQ